MQSFSAGNKVTQAGYSAFIPTPINRIWQLHDSGLQRLLSEADRQLGRLTGVRTQNDIIGWCTFFLQGIIETAKDGNDTFRKTLTIEKSLDARLQPLKGRSAKARQVVLALLNNPVTDVARVQHITGTSSAPAYNLVADLEKMGILKPIRSEGRGQLYVFQEYLNLFL